MTRRRRGTTPGVLERWNHRMLQEMVVFALLVGGLFVNGNAMAAQPTGDHQQHMDGGDLWL
ncbi:MAG TPA: hypothetical protein VGK77_30085 [Candidatus Binatia bacterium]